MEQIPMTYDGRTVGTAEFRQDGLYCRIECRCEPVSDEILRAYARGDGRLTALGVLIPEDGVLRLCRRIPLRHLPDTVESVTVGSKAPSETSSASQAAEVSTEPADGTAEPEGLPESVPEPAEPAAEAAPPAGEVPLETPDAASPEQSGESSDEADTLQWQPWTGTVGGVLVQGGRLGTGRGRTVVALPFRPDQPLPDAELLRRCQPMEMDGQTWLTLELPSGT